MNSKRSKAYVLRSSIPRVARDEARRSDLLRMANEQLVIAGLRDRAEAERARAFLDAFPDAIARFDSSLRHVYVNDASESMNGVARSEAVGKTHGELEMPQELAADWSALIHRVVTTGETSEMTVHLTMPIGPRVFQLRALPERQAGRPIESVVTIARDVTDSQMYRRVREEIRWLLRIQAATASFAAARTVRGVARALATHAHAALEASSAIVLLREEAREFLRIESSVEASDAVLALWNEVALAGPSPIARAVETGRTIALDTLVGNTAPDLVAAHALGVRALFLVPIVIEDRSVSVLVLTFREERGLLPVEFEYLALLAVQASQAFDRARLDRVERAARREAEIASRLKDDFLATMSHELRTPLNAVLGWTTILKHRPREDVQLERGLASIERNARVQARLVDDILDISRITSGKLEMRREQVDIAELVLAAVDDVRHGVDFKGIDLRTSVEKGAVIDADPSRIQQVAWNLLTNAVKFTPRDGRIDVAVSIVGTNVRLDILDSGIGIAPESLPRIYDRFRQLDRTVNRVQNGLGLGLAIVHHIVEAHGGTVVATSAGMGCGTRFVVELPVLRDERVVRVEVPVTPRASNAWRTVRLDGMRVLLVDDDTDSMEIVSIALESLGADVDSATSAADAITSFVAVRPDVLICDIGMPDVDGFGLLHRIRGLSDVVNRATPAIALTGFLRDEDKQRTRAAGFDAHLAKPIDYDLLVRTIQRLARAG